MNYMKKPCPDCPFRRDTPPGQFGSCRYETLRSTIGTDDDMRMPGDPIFACHNTPEGREHACAGWLATQGSKHLTVRLAVATGALPASALSPQEGWPDLFTDYDELARVQGRPPAPAP